MSSEKDEAYWAWLKKEGLWSAFIKKRAEFEAQGYSKKEAWDKTYALFPDEARVIKESGIKQIIDTHLDTFLKSLPKPSSFIGEENPKLECFFVLEEIEKDESMIAPLKSYLAKLPEDSIDMNTILWSGSKYLCAKCFQRYIELLEK